MKQIVYLSCLISYLVLSGCTNKDQMTTISFNDRISFSEFPSVATLDSGTVVETKTIGNLEFQIIDSLLVITTSERENSWKVWSSSNDSILFEFINTGNGPDEFVFPPLISQASFICKNGDSHILIPDNYRHQLRDINLSKSITTRLIESVTEDNPRINDLSVYSNFSTDSIQIYVSLNPSEGTIERAIMKAGSQLNLKNIQHLNRYKVPNPDKLGLLMPNIIYNCNKDRIVEISDLYPQFNIYSLDDKLSITVTPEGKTGSYQQFLDGKSVEETDLIYGGAKGYADFFVINKLNSGTSDLWFLNWDGKPLLDLKLPDSATSFDIDFKNQSLYTLNFKDDIFKKYDLRATLEFLTIYLKDNK